MFRERRSRLQERLTIHMVSSAFRCPSSRAFVDLRDFQLCSHMLFFLPEALVHLVGSLRCPGFSLREFTLFRLVNRRSWFRFGYSICRFFCWASLLHFRRWFFKATPFHLLRAIS